MGKERYINYKRIAGMYTEEEIEKLFKGFIRNGSEIITYFEELKIYHVEISRDEYKKINKNLPEKAYPIKLTCPKRNIIVIIGKRQFV